MIQTRLSKIEDQGRLMLSERTKTIYVKQTTERKLRQNPMVVITAAKSGRTYRITLDTLCWIDPNWIKQNSKSNGSTVVKKKK